MRRRALQFDAALSNMQQGLAMFDNADRLVVANRRFGEMVGAATEALPPGTTATDIMKLAVIHGSFSQDDMAALHLWRRSMVGSQSQSSHTFDMTDGRSLVMTHQPMADGWLATYEDITERRQAEARMAHMAHHDALTDLPNRVLFHEKLAEALAHARRGRPLALLCLDLDQFKAVNDTLGHPIGDALLQAVAQPAAQQVRDTDTVARLGGDEFAVVQAPIDKPTEAADFAERLIAMLDEPFEIDGHQIVIGTSIGIALAPQDGLDADELLKNADLALYRAKADGRGVYRLFDTAMDAAMQARRLLELDLRQALRAGQFEVYYQPLVDFGPRRWPASRRCCAGTTPTAAWYRPASSSRWPRRSALIVPIGEWVLRQACVGGSGLAGRAERLGQPVAGAVQEPQPRCLGGRAPCARPGWPPARLELEITETVMLQDTDATLATLHELRDLGVSIAMDDFGTGYSSLSYLRRFPFDRIKIDQSFVREIDKQRDCGAIIRAVIALSHEFGMATTAEGVETREQLYALAEAGCSDIQGYLFSRPVRLQDIPALLRTMPVVSGVAVAGQPGGVTGWG